MKTGPLAGYQVDSLKVTLTDGSFHPVDSDALSFELAARMGYRKLLRLGAVILEPIMKMEVITPRKHGRYRRVILTVVEVRLMMGMEC
jgi:elongation factor G